MLDIQWKIPHLLIFNLHYYLNIYNITLNHCFQIICSFEVCFTALCTVNFGF